jgi:putative flippase GtrA
MPSFVGFAPRAEARRRLLSRPLASQPGKPPAAEPSPACSTVLIVQGSEQVRGSSGVGAARELARTLNAPESGLLGQGVRFALSGGTVALIYLATTTVLADVAGMPFQAALAIGFCLGLVVHFTLQRVFVWAHHEEFALPLGHQVGRYLAVAAVQYGVTAASTALLPSALGVSTEIVYLVTVAAVVSTNFLVFRNGIFHAKLGGTDPAPESISEPRALSRRADNSSV